MGAVVHIDTSAAHKALDDLIQKAKRVNALHTETHVNESHGALDPAAIAQAKKRYDRRNGTTT